MTAGTASFSVACMLMTAFVVAGRERSNGQPSHHRRNRRPGMHGGGPYQELAEETWLLSIRYGIEEFHTEISSATDVDTFRAELQATWSDGLPVLAFSPPLSEALQPTFTGVLVLSIAESSAAPSGNPQALSTDDLDADCTPPWQDHVPLPERSRFSAQRKPPKQVQIASNGRPQTSTADRSVLSIRERRSDNRRDRTTGKVKQVKPIADNAIVGDLTSRRTHAKSSQRRQRQPGMQDAGTYQEPPATETSRKLTIRYNGGEFFAVIRNAADADTLRTGLQAMDAYAGPLDFSPPLPEALLPTFTGVLVISKGESPSTDAGQAPVRTDTHRDVSGDAKQAKPKSGSVAADDLPGAPRRRAKWFPSPELGDHSAWTHYTNWAAIDSDQEDTSTSKQTPAGTRRVAQPLSKSILQALGLQDENDRHDATDVNPGPAVSQLGCTGRPHSNGNARRVDNSGVHDVDDVAQKAHGHKVTPSVRMQASANHSPPGVRSKSASKQVHVPSVITPPAELVPEDSEGSIDDNDEVVEDVAAHLFAAPPDYVTGYPPLSSISSLSSNPPNSLASSISSPLSQPSTVSSLRTFTWPDMANAASPPPFYPPTRSRPVETRSARFNPPTAYTPSVSRSGRFVRPTVDTASGSRSARFASRPAASMAPGCYSARFASERFGSASSSVATFMSPPLSPIRLLSGSNSPASQSVRPVDPPPRRSIRATPVSAARTASKRQQRPKSKRPKDAPSRESTPRRQAFLAGLQKLRLGICSSSSSVTAACLRTLRSTRRPANE